MQFPQPRGKSTDEMPLAAQHRTRFLRPNTTQRLTQAQRENVWNSVLSNAAIQSIVDALALHNDDFYGFYQVGWFHFALRGFPFGTLDVTTYQIPHQDWHDHLGILRIIEVTTKLHSIAALGSITFGDNAYPIGITVGDMSYPVVVKERQGFTCYAGNKTEVLTHDRDISNIMRAHFLDLAKTYQGVSGPHYSQKEVDNA